jgi:hypothetical protein
MDLAPLDMHTLTYKELFMYKDAWDNEEILGRNK